MLKIMLPNDVFEWVERNRGSMSRAYFIVSVLYKVMEDKPLDYK